MTTGVGMVGMEQAGALAGVLAGTLGIAHGVGMAGMALAGAGAGMAGQVQVGD